MTEAVLPYPERGGGFTSGHSGSETSRERAVNEDGSGVTAFRQRHVLGLTAACGRDGMTVTELRDITGWHHGQASSVLSVLHKEGRLARLTERRGRCQVYVTPEFVQGRETAAHKRNRSQCEQVIDAAHLAKQREWSRETFGPGSRTAGVIQHIKKELKEVEANPFDLEEWIDIVILALDGAWRAGGEPQQIIDTLVAKQVKNMARQWPDWRTLSEDQAIEHVRSNDG